MLMELRNLVFALHPEIKEKVMYGGVMFTLTNDFGGLFVRKKHISFEFSSGNELKDPDKLLEGTGKYRRHLKLYSQDDIQNKKVSYYVEQVE